MNRTLLYSSFLPSSYWNAVISKKRHIDTLSYSSLVTVSGFSHCIIFNPTHLISFSSFLISSHQHVFDSNSTHLTFIIDSCHFVSDVSKPTTRKFVRLISWLWHLFLSHRCPTLRQLRLFITLPQIQLCTFFSPGNELRSKTASGDVCFEKKLCLLLISSPHHFSILQWKRRFPSGVWPTHGRRVMPRPPVSYLRVIISSEVLSCVMAKMR